MELIKSVSIEAEVFKRDNKLKALSQINKLCLDNSLETNIFYGTSSSNAFVLNDSIDKAIKIIDSQAWQFLMQESGIMQFMDSKGRGEWNSKIYERDVPVFNLENIQATFKVLFDSRMDFMERGVINIFKGLSWDYKTNSPCKFGKKIIMNNLVEIWGGCTPHTSFRNCEVLDDLYKFFHILDSKPEPDTRTSAAWHNINAAWQEKNEKFCEDEYVKLKWYLKGSAHIEFKRKDIIDKMNAIIVKHYPNTLPARL